MAERVTVVRLVRDAWRGALLGATAWLAYGVTESLLIDLVPWVRAKPSAVPPDVIILALLIASYAVAGALLGAAWGLLLGLLRGRFGWLRGDRHERLLRVGAILSVVAAFTLNLALHYKFQGRYVVALAACCALPILLVSWVFEHRWQPKLTPLVSPWATTALVVGLTWFVFEATDSRIWKVIALFVYPAVVYAIAATARELSRRLRRGMERNAGRGLAGATLVSMLVVLLVGAAYPPERPIDLRPTAIVSNNAYPNIVLITLDTVRADHLSVYGYDRPTTPNLEAFARHATLYNSAIAASDFTLPSHASMFTGLYARSHGATWDPRYRSSTGNNSNAGVMLLDAKFSTVAEFVESLGYRTLAVVANFGLLDRRLGLAQGFQYYDDRPRRRLPPPPEMFIQRAALDIVLAESSSPYAPDPRRANEINRDVFKLLDGTALDQPFFLFVNYMDAHSPCLPPAPYDRLFPGKSDAFRLKPNFSMRRLERSVMEYGSPLSPTDRDHLVSQYDGAIAYMDDQVARLMDHLKARGVYDNSLIIITSDHGESFGRRNLFGHGVSAYQGQVHVPLIIKFPGSDVGRIVHDDVSHVDLFPTIVDLLGTKVGVHWQGRSLLASSSDSARIVVTESYRNPLHALWDPQYDRTQRALFQGDLKLVRSSRGKVELYDLKSDPEEQTDLSAGRKSDAARLESRLDHWLEHTENLISRGPASGSPIELDRETLQRLRALGYIPGDG